MAFTLSVYLVTDTEYTVITETGVSNWLTGLVPDNLSISNLNFLPEKNDKSKSLLEGTCIIDPKNNLKLIHTFFFLSQNIWSYNYILVNTTVLFCYRYSSPVQNLLKKGIHLCLKFLVWQLFCQSNYAASFKRMIV